MLHSPGVTPEAAVIIEVGFSCILVTHPNKISIRSFSSITPRDSADVTSRRDQDLPLKLRLYIPLTCDDELLGILPGLALGILEGGEGHHQLEHRVQLREVRVVILDQIHYKSPGCLLKLGQLVTPRILLLKEELSFLASCGVVISRGTNVRGWSPAARS